MPVHSRNNSADWLLGPHGWDRPPEKTILAATPEEAEAQFIEKNAAPPPEPPTPPAVNETHEMTKNPKNARMSDPDTKNKWLGTVAKNHFEKIVFKELGNEKLVEIQKAVNDEVKRRRELFGAS